MVTTHNLHDPTNDPETIALRVWFSLPRTGLTAGAKRKIGQTLAAVGYDRPMIDYFFNRKSKNKK